MPLYEFRCPSCGTEFELLLPMRNDGKPVRCPKCGTAADRLMSRCNFKVNVYNASNGYSHSGRR